MHQAGPVAAENFQVRAARRRHDRAARPALVGVKLAREQRLQADLVGLDLQDFELQPLLLGKAARFTIMAKPASLFASMMA